MIENADGTVTLHGQEALEGFAHGVSALLEGNPPLHYKTKFQGIPVSVENRKGSIRRGGRGEDAWETKMKHPYGRIPRTKGADSEAIDTYIGPKKDAEDAFVVHQKDPETGKFDEDKVMLGFDSKKKAKKAFLAHYDKPGFLGPISEVPMDKLKDKLEKVRKTGDKLAKIQEAEEYGVKGQKWGRRKQVQDQHGLSGQKLRKFKQIISTTQKKFLMKQYGTVSADYIGRKETWTGKDHQVRVAKSYHEALVAFALRRGMPVSARVLKDYPGLRDKGKTSWEINKEKVNRARKMAGYDALESDGVGLPPEHSLGQESRTLEAKRPKIYYARSYQKYGTAQEAGDLDFLEEAYPGHRIVALTRCRKRGRKNMGYFHNKVEEADEVIISPFKKNRVTAGVYSEAKHALKQGIPVKVLRRGQLLSVKEVEVLDNPNPKGEFGKFVLKRSKFR